MIGEQLGHYELREEIGSGAMGVIYRAHDAHLDRPVAVKILADSVSSNPESMERFRREAKAVAALSHPNILSIFDFGNQEQTAFAVMELLQGQTLREYLEANTPPPPEALELGRQIAAGLSAAHDKNILHRDINPNNIFLTRQGLIKILDFGLAKHTAIAPPSDDTLPMDSAEFVLGTPGYASPEQVRGATVDTRTDVFSLGCVLYELFAGQPAFPGKTPADRMGSCLKDAPLPLDVIIPGLFPELVALIHGCLEKNPNQRVDSVREVEQTLRAIEDRMRIPSVAHLSRRKMVAVLPFENLGPSEEDYFAAGITEEITSRLASISDLGVISRTTATQYDRTRKTIREIGRDLGAGYILEGTVRWDRTHNRVRITPQLIRVSDDTHLWAGRYDRVLDDIFAVQSEIAQHVIERLEANLLEGKEHAPPRPTSNLEAYQAYLRGLNHSSEVTITEEDVRLAIMMFEKAVELDPEFADAYARLALDHSALIVFGYDASPERKRLAKEAADRVTQLAPGSYPAHVAQGYYYYRCEKDYDRASQEFQEAAEQRPNDVTILSSMAYVQRREGKWKEALANLEKAVALDSPNAVRLAQLGITLSLLREYPRADDMLQQSISYAPDQVDAYLERAKTLWLWGDRMDAAEEVLLSAPMQANPRTQLSWYMQETYRRQWESALRRVASSRVDVFIEQDEFFPRALLEHWCLVRLNEPKRALVRAAEAKKILERAQEDEPMDVRVHLAQGLLEASLGHKEEALHKAKVALRLAPIEKDALVGGVVETYVAMIYAQVKEHQEALDRIESLLSSPVEVSPAILTTDPAWDDLRDCPRFKFLVSASEPVLHWSLRR